MLLRFVLWSPIVRAYLPVPEGATVQVMQRLGPLTRVSASGEIGPDGRIQLDLPDDPAEPAFELSLGGDAVDLRTGGRTPPGAAGAWTPPDPWAAWLGHRRPRGAEGAERPFEVRAGRDAFLRFVRWDEPSGRFRPVPAGLVVEAWDAEPWAPEPLASGLTGADGEVWLRIEGAEARPDVYITLRTLPGLDHIGADGQLGPGPEGLRLPARWSSREPAAHRSERAGRGYWSDFAGQRIGTPENPYVFALDGHARRFGGNRVEPVVDGPALLSAWEALLASARHTIHFEVMLYFDDPMGRRFQARLLERARAGVQVRLLIGIGVTEQIAGFIETEKLWARVFRTFGPQERAAELRLLDAELVAERKRGAIAAMIAELRAEPNVRVIDTTFSRMEILPGVKEGLPAAYQELEDRLPFVSFARVDHRKVLVVDGRAAVLGGQNVGQEYLYERPFDPAREDRDEEWCKWHDVSVRLEGPVVRDLQLRFRERWVSEGGDRFPFGPMADGAGTDPGHPCFPRLDPVAGGLPARVVDTTPGARFQYHEAILGLVSGAEREIWILDPYFSSPETLGALKRAAHRGVRVVFVLPDQRNDSIDFLYAGRLWYGEMIEAGIEVYEYQRHMCHAKVAVFDDVALIGTANLNHSSYFYHYELAAIVEDAGFARDLRRRLWDRDLAHCRRIRTEDLPELLDINAACEAYLRNVVHRRF